ncbi:twin-arginine translocase subunit TatC [Streptomyces sp. NPDC004393]
MAAQPPAGSALALVAGAVAGWLLRDWLLEPLTGPACALSDVHGVGRPTPRCPNGLLVSTGILSPLSLGFRVSVTAGFVMVASVWSYQLCAFIAPGLYKREEKDGVGSAVAPPCSDSAATSPTCSSLRGHLIWVLR